MKKRTFSLAEKQIAALQRLSKQTGLVISEHVRRAIDAYFSDIKRTRRK
jgi:predicted DNA-binding protein